MARGTREPDALDLWFARQRRAWWKKWRWAVYAGLLVLLVLLTAEAAMSAWMAWHRTLSNAKWMPVAEFFARWSYPASTYVFSGLLALGLLLGTTAAKEAIPSAELALSQRTEWVFAALNRYARRALWSCTAVFYVLPGVVSAALFAAAMMLYPWKASAPSFSWEIPLNAVLALSANAVLAAEGQACVLRRTVASRKLSWLLVTPFTAVVGAKLARELIGEAVWNLNLWLWIYGGFWSSLGLSVLILGAGIALAFIGRSPPRGFTGSAEA